MKIVTGLGTSAESNKSELWGFHSTREIGSKCFCQKKKKKKWSAARLPPAALSSPGFIAAVAAMAVVVLTLSEIRFKNKHICQHSEGFK